MKFLKLHDTYIPHVTKATILIASLAESVKPPGNKKKTVTQVKEKC